MRADGRIFEDHTWFGEFYFPGRQSERFVGEINRSPKSGIVLKICSTHALSDSLEKIIYGVLSSGQKCTLFDGYDPKHVDGFMCGREAIYQGYASFKFMVLGGWFEADKKCDELYFSFQNGQNFFRDDFDHWNSDFSLDTILDVELKLGSIRLWDQPRFKVITNPKGVFHSFDAKVLDDLLERFDTFKKNKSSPVHLKESNDVRFMLSFKDPVDFFEAYKEVCKVGELMAVLMFRPVYPDVIWTVIRDEDEGIKEIYLFPSLVLSERVIEIVNKPCRTCDLPMSFHGINFSCVIRNWMESDWSSSLVVADIQTSDGYDYIHRVRGDIVVYCTIIEEISARNKVVSQRKYEAVISEYSSALMGVQLGDLLAICGANDIGTFVSALRGEIAHTGRPKKILKVLEFRHLCAMAMILRLVVLGYMLRELGICKGVIDGYQSSQMVSHAPE